ncbi:MAG: glycoside hydrolase family 3 C-terminal domain-containing protein [Oscillospiraceae bacterium]|nr:glycoside hydrolase family 3 C-terminal domain-containing protein [Oscillospiraceae bacterium]
MYPFESPALDTRKRVDDLLSRLTIDEKIGLLSTHNQPIERFGIGEWFVGHEIARGLVNREPENPSTVFPQPLGMAASFDKDMMLAIGQTAAREARAYYNERKNGGLMVWGPTVDLSRDPRWGRTEECYGEDPCLTGEMTAQYTKGLRGDGNVWATIPTLKHFCANNHEEHRAHDNANLNPRLKHEHYYAAFRTPVMYGDAYSVMTAYNEICHTPADMLHDLKDVLKKEWGLGFVVTDGADFSQNVTAHHTFDSHAKALQACLYAGTDVMTDDVECVRAAAEKALAEGLISEADIDRAVGNLLESRVLLGHFDAETPFDSLTRADVNTDADKALNLRVAREGMVLLQNRCQTLPLNAEKHRKIGLFGQNADCNLLDWYTGISSYAVSIRKGLEEHGCEVVYDIGWDIVNLRAPNGCYVRIDEDDCLYADATEETAAKFYYCVHDHCDKWVNLRDVASGRFVCIDGDTPKLGKTEVYGWFTSETLCIELRQPSKMGTGSLVISDYLHGRQFCLDEQNRLTCRAKARPDKSVYFNMPVLSYGEDRIASLAVSCDAVVYCGGNDPQQVARECYDRDTITLPYVQGGHLRELYTALKKAEIPLIFVIVSSYPYSLLGFADKLDTVLWTSHAGPELGHAFAETLFGENNPAGRCPVTWYASDDDLPDIKDYDIMKTKMTYRWFDGEPLYPFGHGLSYSQFSYDNMQTEVTLNGIRVTADITNLSNRDGDEVVQIYAHAQSVRIPRPLKQLCAFDRLHVRAGETVRFETLVPFRELELYDVSGEKLCLEDGDYDLMLGASSADIRCTATVHVPGETILPRDLTKETKAELWDAQENTEIFTDALTGETHVRGLGWSNSLIFQNCDLTGAKQFVIRAAAPVEALQVNIYLDNAQQAAAEITVPSCDGFTDFKTLTVPLTADGCHNVRIAFPQNACIKSIQIINR